VKPSGEDFSWNSENGIGWFKENARVINNLLTTTEAISQWQTHFGVLPTTRRLKRTVRNSVTVVHPMHRSRGCLDCCCSDSLAFATEPVLGSLANLLGAVERLPINCQQELKVRPPPPPPLFTPPPHRERGVLWWACLSLSMCVFVCPRAYLRNYTSDLHYIFMHVTYGSGSVLLWRRSDMLCTSGFVNDVMFVRKPRLLDVAA